MKILNASLLFWFLHGIAYAGQSSGGGPSALHVGTDQFAALIANLKGGNLIGFRDDDGTLSVYRPYFFSDQSKILAAVSQTDARILIITGVEENDQVTILESNDLLQLSPEFEN